MSESTITVQNVVSYAQQHTALMPLTGVGGISNEPALSIANDTKNILLGENFPWKFNRVEMNPLITAPYQQDYKFAGASAFTIVGGGVGIALTTSSGITQSGSTVTVNLLESCQNIINAGDTVYLSGVTQSGIAAVFTPGRGNSNSGSAWSNGFTVATVAGNYLSFTFTYAPVISTDGASGITDLSWLEYATMVPTGSTASVPIVWHLPSVRNLQPASYTQQPRKISMVKDLNTGVIVLRLDAPAPNAPFTLSPIYQKKPVLFTSLSDTWTPIPDRFAAVYRQTFVAMCYRYASSPKEVVEFQKAMAMAQAACGTDDREDSDEFITPSESLMGWSWYWSPF